MFASLSSGLSMPKSAVLIEPKKIVHNTTPVSIAWTFGLLCVVLVFLLILRWWRKPKDAYLGRTLPGVDEVPKVAALPLMPLKPEYTPPFLQPEVRKPEAVYEDIVSVVGPIPTWSAEEEYDGPEQRVTETDETILDMVRAREAFTKDMEAEMKLSMTTTRQTIQ